MKNYAMDRIEDTDYDIETLLWAVEELPKSVMLSDDEVQNQRYSDPYGCVFFAWSSISNTMNYINKEDSRISWAKLCDIAINAWYLDPNVWAYVSTSPRLLRDLELISAYWLCKTIDDVKLSLYHKKPVQTWSNSIDWNATKWNNNVAVRWSSYWHSFFICWYDEEYLICENSYWENEFDKWYFYIKYSDFDLLFNSKYTMTDTKWADTLYKEKVRSEINLEDAKKFYDRGFTNWLNPTENITREEVWATMERMIKD